MQEILPTQSLKDAQNATSVDNTKNSIKIQESPAQILHRLGIAELAVELFAAVSGSDSTVSSPSLDLLEDENVENCSNEESEQKKVVAAEEENKVLDLSQSANLL